MHARGDAGQRDHRAGRPGAGARPPCSCRPWWSTGCSPSCSAARRRQVFDALATPGPPATLDELVGGDAGPLLDAARLAVTMRRTRVHPPRPAAPGHRRVGARCSTCPTCSPGPTGCGPPARWPPRSARSWATDGRAHRSKRATRPAAGPTRGHRHHRRPAGHQGDRGRLRAGRGGQDHHGGRRRGDGGRPPRRQGAGAHRRPGQAAGRRPRSRRHRQHRAPGARRGLPGRRGQAPGRAVGGHARHQGVVGRPDPPARPRRADPRRDPGQPALPEHLRPLRPEPRLHRHGAALRDPLRGRLRPDRGGHPADPQRPRLPRRPPAAWPTSSPPACCAG